MNTVKPTLTDDSRPRRRVVQNDEFAAFARRVILAHGPRLSISRQAAQQRWGGDKP